MRQPTSETNEYNIIRGRIDDPASPPDVCSNVVCRNDLDSCTLRRPNLLHSLVACLFLFSTTSAAVFERDWLSPGNGLLTFDDVNQREWLDLSESLLEQFSGDTLEKNYPSVVAETRVGDIFEGFSVAKGEDAEALAISGGIDIVLRIGSFDHNLIPTTNIINLLGVTDAVTATDFGSF